MSSYFLSKTACFQTLFFTENVGQVTPKVTRTMQDSGWHTPEMLSHEPIKTLNGWNYVCSCSGALWKKENMG
jgi:hypothetical protein